MAHHLIPSRLRVARSTMALLACVALTAQASVLDTRSTRAAQEAQLYDTYHDQATDFVFVRLPSGWKFVGRDALSATHAVFHDPATGFVFVNTSGQWSFVGKVE